MKWAVGLLWAIGLGMCLPIAADANVQFSAIAVQSAPDGRSREARMFVGDNQVRMERRKGDVDMVEIYDMKAQRVVLLVPGQKVYMQRDLPEGVAVNPMLPKSKANPCSTLPGSSCRQLGKEMLYDRSVSKWEVTLEREGKLLRSLHWIDDERFMSLRDAWPDGTVTEVKLIGMEMLNGRETERWQKTMTAVGGEQKVSMQWYDPEIQIMTREELPGGFFRELKNIEVAPQPPALFEAPAGYQRLESEEPGER